ncbi:hypothetical protein [Saccharopolyspora elongata]|uniref:hypothetical protein n=1 Tax=Saccharopolyspora elongata TaxID=2530387 RepID=UPI001A9F4A42|nr:hypothetical protein [Saccharopolyspora elongata]
MLDALALPEQVCEFDEELAKGGEPWLGCPRMRAASKAAVPTRMPCAEYVGFASSNDLVYRFDYTGNLHSIVIVLDLTDADVRKTTRRPHAARRRRPIGMRAASSRLICSMAASISPAAARA